jgi:LysM repeat protein
MIKLLILIGFSLSAEAPKDSIGVETINGKVFVIHKVDEKETLFAISRRYRTTVDAIIEYNKEAGEGLEIGQVLKVPYTPKAAYRPSDAIVHTVAAKETMYFISKKYGVTMDEIRQWNKLSDNATLSIGQELIIKKKTTGAPVKPEVIVRKGIHTVATGETVFSIVRLYGITQQQLKDWNNLEGTELKIGQTLFVAQPEKAVVTKKPDSVKTPVVVKSSPVQPVVTTPTPVNETKKDPEPAKTSPTEPTQTIKISESYKNGSETIEAGLAELIEGTEGNRKYLALHRTAPIGTILKIRNEMNNREVFVRVMGKLPDTALTDKLIIRISKSAYDRLGAIDQRFRVEVTYYK